MNYQNYYDAIIELQEQLKTEHLNGIAATEQEALLNYDLIQALSATYTLENYLASRISNNTD